MATATATKSRTRKPVAEPVVEPVELTADAKLANVTLAIHSRMIGFDDADKAYTSARTLMVEHGVRVARVTASLYTLAIESFPDMLAKRGTNAGNPAVDKLATHLGYERRRFDKFYHSAVALIGAKVTLDPDADITPEDLELVAPFFTKDAKRKAAKRAESAPAPAPSGDSDDSEDAGETAGSPAESDGGPVILADVMRAISALESTVDSFVADKGIDRDTMDGIADAMADILAKLESVTADA